MMNRPPRLWPALITIVLGTGACSAADILPPENEFGPTPTLTAPDGDLIPTLKPAKAIGWPEGGQPTPAKGLAVNAFARGLDHPRWLLPLPNGDVLVAESQSPAGTGGFSGLKGWFADKMMAYAGAGGKSADRITLLRDTDGDGVADIQTALITGLHSPLGMTLTGGYLYVANTDALVRFPFVPGQTRVEAMPEHIVDLPGGPLNHHWTKNVIASPDGRKLYVSVGSNSNIADKGMEVEHHRAAILEIDLETHPTEPGYRVFASGLRNPVGLDWNPATGALWTVVNERDELGNQLVPDYLTAVVDGGFYGWPWSYWGQNVDTRVNPQRPDDVATALPPDYALGAHTASLGLAFYRHETIGAFTGGALIGQHGSWNRNPRSGYKVIFVPFEGSNPVGMPRDVLTGFLSADGDAYGRPAGVAVDVTGAILVADDAGNTIWRVTAIE